MQRPSYPSIWISELRMFATPEVFHNPISHLDKENRLTSGWVTHPLTGYDNIGRLLFLCSVIFFLLIELISVVGSKTMSKTMNETLQWVAAHCFPGIKEIQSLRWAAVVLAQLTAELSSMAQEGFPNQRNQWGNWESLQEPIAHAITPLWAYAQNDNVTWNGILLYLPTAVQSGLPSHQSRAVPAHGTQSDALTVLVW